jgi:hypothetical protein
MLPGDYYALEARLGAAQPKVIRGSVGPKRDQETNNQEQSRNARNNQAYVAALSLSGGAAPIGIAPRKVRVRVTVRHASMPPASAEA